MQLPADRDVQIVRYGGDQDSPEGGEALFLADSNEFESKGPPGGVDLLQGYEDDTLIVRARYGELEEREEAEWITRRAVPVTNPSGALVLGSWFPNQYGPNAPYVHPPWFTSLDGSSQLSVAVVYTYLPFLIARGGLIEAMSMPEVHDQVHPWGSWFRESRPGQDMPDWLVRQCANWPGIDPGHEDEWEGGAHRRQAQKPPTVEVLIQLRFRGDQIPSDETRDLADFPLGFYASL